MRLLIWMLGVECTMVAIMHAYEVARGWVWVFWLWFGLWSLVGGVVLVASLARTFAGRPPTGVGRIPAMQSVPRVKAEGGE